MSLAARPDRGPGGFGLPPSSRDGERRPSSEARGTSTGGGWFRLPGFALRSGGADAEEEGDGSEASASAAELADVVGGGSYSLRLGAVLMCEATALFGQAVLCAIFAANDPAQIDTSTALILLILVAMRHR